LRFLLRRNDAQSTESTKPAVAFVFALLNKAMAAEECDARGDASYSIAWFKIIAFKNIFKYLSLQISATKI